MRLVVSLSLLFSAAAPSARAAAVRPDAPKPPVPEASEPRSEPAPPRPRRPNKKYKKNKAFLAATPHLEDPRWTVPARLTRLIPEFEEENETDAYLDLFLNEEAEELP